MKVSLRAFVRQSRFTLTVWHLDTLEESSVLGQAAADGQHRMRH